MYELSTSKARVLDFDIETRRIGFHSAGMFAPDGCEPVAIGFKWIGENDAEVKTWSQGMKWSERKLTAGVQTLFDAFEEADLVTGHYIRKFDLPILAGVAFEFGLKMPTVLTVDTKVDLKPMAGLSQSQENLSRMKRLDEEKFPMSDEDWRRAARLTHEGLREAVMRVERDVYQHEALYTTFVAEEALLPPQEWKS